MQKRTIPSSICKAGHGYPLLPSNLARGTTPLWIWIWKFLGWAGGPFSSWRGLPRDLKRSRCRQSAEGLGYARRFSVLGLVEDSLVEKYQSHVGEKKQIGVSCDCHDELHRCDQLFEWCVSSCTNHCVKLHPDSSASGAACWRTREVGCVENDRRKKKKDNTNVGSRALWTKERGKSAWMSAHDGSHGGKVV